MLRLLDRPDSFVPNVLVIDISKVISLTLTNSVRLIRDSVVLQGAPETGKLEIGAKI